MVSQLEEVEARVSLLAAEFREKDEARVLTCSNFDSNENIDIMVSCFPLLFLLLNFAVL